MGKQGKKQSRVKTKQYTRAQAIKALRDGTKRPEEFFDVSDPFRTRQVLKPGQEASNQSTVNHNNVHVRQLAFKMLGSPYPSDPAEKAKLMENLRIKDKSVVVDEQTNEETINEGE